jgi:3-isopropylmalate/(R)-2-methylmalate dehydratase small subunit
MKLEGLIHMFGDHIDTDRIIPAQYCVTADPVELAKHVLKGEDLQFCERVGPGDLIFAGENFGCGSSREHAPLAIQGAGVRCLVAASFARIFYRNSINIGLPVLICPEAAAAARNGDRAQVDLTIGTITVNGRSYRAEPFPPFVQSLVSLGGLLPYVKAKLLERGLD